MSVAEYVRENGEQPGVPWLLQQNREWITNDGTVMRVDDMTLSHKQNVLRMLRKLAFVLKFSYELNLIPVITGPMGPRGEAAQDAVEQVFDTLLMQSDREWLDEQPLAARLIADIEAVGKRTDSWLDSLLGALKLA